MKDQKTVEKLKQDGRNLFDQMQTNLTSVTSGTDVELRSRLEERNSIFGDMFGGGAQDCEGWRQESREAQDKLDRKGREAFAQEHAETQNSNL